MYLLYSQASSQERLEVTYGAHYLQVDMSVLRWRMAHITSMSAWASGIFFLKYIDQHKVLLQLGWYKKGACSPYMKVKIQGIHPH